MGILIRILREAAVGIARAVDTANPPATTTTTTTTTSIGESGLELPNPLVAGDIGEIIVKVGEFLIYISTAVLTIFILWGAFQLMTSGGSPERVEKGRKTIYWAILGFVVLLVAGGVGAIVVDILGGSNVDSIQVGDAPISNFEGVRAVLITIAQWMFGILMALGIVMILYSAFLYLFSGGDDTRISTARKTLTYAVVALVIAVLAGGVGVLVQNLIGSTVASVDCEVSEWSEWGQCGTNGRQSRSREITTPSSGSGEACPSLTQSRFCGV